MVVLVDGEGTTAEGRRWLEAALGKEVRASAVARAKALTGVGWLATMQGDLDRAEAAAEEGLKLSTQAGIRSVRWLLISAHFRGASKSPG